MSRSFAGAIGLGVGILLVAHLLWPMVLMSKTYPALAAWTLHASPVFAAFAVAYLVPRKKILFGMSMMLVAATMSAVANLLYRELGLPTDLPGFRGSWIVFAVGLVSGTVLCGIGTVVGYLLSRKTTSAELNAE